MTPLLANAFYETHPSTGAVLLRATPLILGVLCVLAIAYRYYSAFLAAKVLALDPGRPTPAHRLNDGSNFHPTNRWVLFGHHFAAIAGAGPLIGPVLAMQYGYAPGLLWLVIGVCLAGAVQDMLVMAASTRRGGRSLPELAREFLGKTPGTVAGLAVLVIVVIALAGLALIVVKALGGEAAALPQGAMIRPPAGQVATFTPGPGGTTYADLPPESAVRYRPGDREVERKEKFRVQIPAGVTAEPDGTIQLPKDAKGVIREVIPGSAWGTFTIACTIPIALLVGLWMYKIRPGRVGEASLLGGVLILAAVVGGAEIKGTALEPIFTLTREGTIIALAVYGFVAAVLPVWLLLTPRDYLSSFMKVGTLILMVVGVIIANPTLKQPAFNETFSGAGGGPTFPGGLFPFVFICVMCGAVSGFHALVSSGTTPKMLNSEKDIRPIGYGAMLTESLVGVIALIAAASMPPERYYAINVDLDKVGTWQPKLDAMYEQHKTAEIDDPLQRQLGGGSHGDLSNLQSAVGGESLRGRSGGAVTLAVGMADILTEAFTFGDRQIDQVRGLIGYWYHFAIMFEALFILTTIDAGTRIARYLLQEMMGKISPRLGRVNYLPGACLAAFLITAGWATLVWSGSIGVIWSMFGIANQLLAVMALAVVSTYLVTIGKRRYLWVTLIPMGFVAMTTTAAGKTIVSRQLSNLNAGTDPWTNGLNLGLTLFVMLSVYYLILVNAAKWLRPAVRKED